MSSSRGVLAIMPLMLAGLACSGPGGLIQSVSSGVGGEEATASQTATVEVTQTQAPPTTTPTALPDPDPTETVVPETEVPEDPERHWPNGTYTAIHDEGTIVCESGLNETIPAGNETVVTIEWQNDGQSLQVTGFEGGRMQFTLLESGEGGFSMVSEGVYGGVPITHTLFFIYGIDWIEGTIESEVEGCTVNRSFVASPN